LIGVAIVCWMAAAPVMAQDYLSPELRAEVEQLKAEVAAAPTTPQTMAERCDVLWQWANAFALAGGVIPNDLPLLVRASRLADDPDSEQLLARYLPFVDHFVRELQLKDEVPWALGWLSLQADDPLAAESWQTVVQTWTVGGVPMAEGGAIYLGRDGFNNHGRPQAKDPEGDNYFTIHSSNPDARFVYEKPPDSPTIITQLLAVFRLEGATLRAGDQQLQLPRLPGSGGQRLFLPARLARRRNRRQDRALRGRRIRTLDRDGGGGIRADGALGGRPLQPDLGSCFLLRGRVERRAVHTCF
jgi:hypothetical protein